MKLEHTLRPQQDKALCPGMAMGKGTSNIPPTVFVIIWAEMQTEGLNRVYVRPLVVSREWWNELIMRTTWPPDFCRLYQATVGIHWVYTCPASQK